MGLHEELSLKWETSLMMYIRILYGSWKKIRWGECRSKDVPAVWEGKSHWAAKFPLYLRASLPLGSFLVHDPCPCLGMFSCRNWMETSPKGLLMWLKLADSLDFGKTSPNTEGSEHRVQASCLPRKAVHSLPWARAPLLSSALHSPVHKVEKLIDYLRCTAISSIRPPRFRS